MTQDPFDVLLRTFEDFKSDYRALVFEHNLLAKKISSIAGQLKILYFILTPLVVKLIVSEIHTLIKYIG